jgi:Zn-dependent protease
VALQRREIRQLVIVKINQAFTFRRQPPLSWEGRVSNMVSFFSSIGPEVPVVIFLVLLMCLHRGVKPKASLWIKAPPSKVYEAIDFYDGKRENWGQTISDVSLIDAAKGIFEKTYVTTLKNGSVQRFAALFSVVKRERYSYLEIAREGLEGKSKSRELLKLFYVLKPEGEGTRLTITYHWGPRMALAQLTARADLWGGIYRIKGLVERGVADDRPYYLISLALSILTGLVSVGAFAWMLSVKSAALIVIALAVHEFGHLLAYSMMGQPWGRMIFLPFLGAIAMPRLPFESQGQVVFAALMGPGFSVLLAMGCVGGSMLWPDMASTFTTLGIITVLLNMSNLLPVEPLDGGVALRSMLHWLMGRFARFGLMAAGALILAVGIYVNQALLMLIGMVAIVANFKPRTIDPGLRTLSMLQVCISLFGYAALLVSYIAMIGYFSSDLLSLV